MRVVLRVILVLCLVAGLVFAGQGAGLIPGSFMTGRSEWAVIGSILAAVGAIGLWWTTRRRM
ncbi:MAG TPA: hypothetical protein VM052_07090 [Candidatus Limnocylindrales bacterium]|nr:hypothetical protein [Candidatus Limnocylindrales bacterium]